MAALKHVSVDRVDDLPCGKRVFQDAQAWHHHLHRYRIFYDQGRHNYAGNEAHLIGRHFEDANEYEDAIRWHSMDVWHQRQVGTQEKQELRVKHRRNPLLDKWIDKLD